MRLAHMPMLGAVIGLTVVACGSPSSLAHVQAIKRLPLTSQTVFYGPEGRNLFRVFDIASVSDGKELRLVTSDGVVWTTSRGVPVRRVDFIPSRNPLFPVRRLRNGATDYYAGFDPRTNQLAFFDAEGREIAARPCNQCWDLVAADINAPGRDSLVVRAIDGKAGKVFGPHGETESEILAKGYLTDLKAFHVGDELQASLVFYSSPDPELQEAVRIRRGDGEERFKWTIDAAGAVATATNTEGKATILSIEGNTLAEWDATSGRVLSRTAIEGSSAFRHIYADRLIHGSRVVVLSGAGSLSKHMVVVIDSTGSVVFQEIGDGRSFALHCPPEQSVVFFVAIEGQVKRYSLE